MPKLHSASKGEIIWTEQRDEGLVYVVRDAIFAAVSHDDKENEVSAALYGTGAILGLTDEYVSYVHRETYHLRTVISGCYCSFPAKLMGQVLEKLPPKQSFKILCSSLTNQFAASYTLKGIVSKSSLSKQLTSLLAHLYALQRQGGNDSSILQLTHEELSLILSSSRNSITRLLDRLSDTGVLDIGYGSITLNDSFLDKVEDWAFYKTHIAEDAV